MATSDRRLVVFDLGGVIVRICRSFEEGCRAAGVPVRARGADGPTMEQHGALVGRFQTGEIGFDEFCAAESELHGGVYSPGEIASITDAWLLGEYEGVDGLIHELHDAGHATGLLSNTNHRHWELMQASYGTPWLTHLPHASHLMRLAKPDAAIFDAFVDSTGRGPSEIVFFDDLQDNVDAAIGAGWHAHRVDHNGATARQMREHLRVIGVL